MMPTKRGILLLLGAAPLIAAATWLPLLEWIAVVYVLASLALLAADWRAAGPVRRFDVERGHDTKLSLGANNSIQLAVRHRGPRLIPFQIRDDPPAAFAIDRHILKGRASSQKRWREAYHARPRRRGDYEFGNITLRWLGPLGLAWRQGHVEAAETVKVYPNLLGVRRYDLLLRQNRLQEIGLRHTRLPGQGTEFERLREYSPDDEYRRINWKATARRHRPITTEYQTERSQNIVAVLDTGRMMQSPVAEMAKLDHAVNAVLLLAYAATGMGDKVGLMTFAGDVDHFLKPRQGRAQFYRMLERLYAVEAQPVEPDYRRALAYLAQKQRKRALIIIFTDLTSGASLQALVQHVRLLARRSLPLVVTISEPDLHEMAQRYPQNSLDVYRRAAAGRLLQERELVLDSLQRQGVMTLDAQANQLSIAVVNRYLELKRGLRL
jgi:uncharacterized protein (DUF58 family)